MRIRGGWLKTYYGSELMVGWNPRRRWMISTRSRTSAVSFGDPTSRDAAVSESSGEILRSACTSEPDTGGLRSSLTFARGT